MNELGGDTIDVMRNIKRALDPYWLLNPGKIFEPTGSEMPLDSRKVTAATSTETPSTKPKKAHV